MNNKISGAKMVLVPIRQTGKNYFPYVEDLKNRYIKFIDFHASDYLPGTDAPGLKLYQPTSVFLTLANEIGNKLLFNEMPLENFDYQYTRGVRSEIGSKLSLQNCYIDCQDASIVGKTAAVVFYYDLPQFSARNKTDNLITDCLSVPVTTLSLYNTFPDSERMSGKRFRLINFTTVSQTPDYYPGVTQYQDEVYVTLRKGSFNVLENVPLSVFQQQTFITKLEFANIIFDFQASYMVIGGAGTNPNITTGKAVFLNFTYEE